MTAPESLAPKSLVERLREAADIYRPFAGFGDLVDLLEEAAQALTPKTSAAFLAQQERRRNCDHKARAWPGAACPTCGDGLPV